jgi:hypothetical protein
MSSGSESQTTLLSDGSIWRFDKSDRTWRQVVPSIPATDG